MKITDIKAQTQYFKNALHNQLRYYNKQWYEHDGARYRPRHRDQIIALFQGIDLANNLNQTTANINEYISQARIELGLHPPANVITPFRIVPNHDQITSINNIIPLQNTLITLDFETGLITQSAPDPNIFNEHALPVTYDPAATCPTFDRCMTEWFPTDSQRKIAWEVLGYCLVPWNGLKRIPVLYGEKDCGKTLYANVIEDLIGDDVVAGVQLHRLDQPDRQSLLTAYVNFCHEARYMDADVCNMLKVLSSGGDKLTINVKYRDPVTGRLFLKVIISGNDEPYFSPDDQALWDRLLMLHFHRPASLDRHMRKKIQAEIAGVFNKALAALQQLVVMQDFSFCGHSDELLGDFRRGSDNVSTFLADGPVTLGPAESCLRDRLYEAYAGWAKNNNYRPVTSDKFTKRIKQITAEQKQPIEVERRMADKRRDWWIFGISTPTSHKWKDGTGDDFWKQRIMQGARDNEERKKGVIKPNGSDGHQGGGSTDAAQQSNNLPENRTEEVPGTLPEAGGSPGALAV